MELVQSCLPQKKALFPVNLCRWLTFLAYMYSLFTRTLLFLTLCVFSLFTGYEIGIFHSPALGLVLIALFIDPEALDFVMVLIYFL